MNMMIAKWGNSLGVRIPRAIAEEVGVSSGMPVRLSARKGQILIEPVRYDLATLVAGISTKNRHGESDTGAPMGNEIW